MFALLDSVYGLALDFINGLPSPLQRALRYIVLGFLGLGAFMLTVAFVFGVSV
jgi:hypothetical protein